MSLSYSEQIASMIQDAARTEETHSLAGITPADLADDDGVVPLVGYEELEAALREGLAELQRMRSHQHVWDYGETESDPVVCSICGADGLA